MFEQIQTLFVEVKGMVNLPQLLTYAHDDTEVQNIHCLHLISCTAEAEPNISLPKFTVIKLKCAVIKFKLCSVKSSYLSYKNLAMYACLPK